MIWKTLILLTGSESPVRLLIDFAAFLDCFTVVLGTCSSANPCCNAHATCCKEDVHLDITTFCIRSSCDSIQGQIMQVVVVLSGSMEPGFYRGDILFLNMGHRPIRVGEVVVFNIDQRDIPIVHRVIKVHERQPGGEVDVLTKVCFAQAPLFLRQTVA